MRGARRGERQRPPWRSRRWWRASDSVQVIALGSVTYMRGSRAYYAAQPKLTPEQVATYDDRWLKLSTASNPPFAPDT